MGKVQNKTSKVSKKPKAQIESQLPLRTNGNTVVVNIKTEFFNQILDGTKTSEYRKNTKFYERALLGKTFITLMCGPYKALTMKIGDVSIVKTPANVVSVVGCDTCFKIDVTPLSE